MQIWRYALAHEVRWVTLLSVQGSLVPLAPLPLTRCEGRIGCAGRVAIIKSRQSRPKGGFGWWRLMPPGYGGRRLRAGRETKDPSSVSFADTCLPAGRSAGLTRHRRVIQHREPCEGKAWGCGGRREKHLPWLKQAAASASAPVSVHAVLLTDNGDERLYPREDAGNHSRP